jgi:hypothetical protein
MAPKRKTRAGPPTAAAAKASTTASSRASKGKRAVLAEHTSAAASILSAGKSGSPPDDTVDADDGEAKAKRIRRRDAESSADRALKMKFSHIRPERLDAITNERGERPLDLVLARMSKNKGCKKNIKTEFWLGLQHEFGLDSASAYSSLSPPSDAEEVDDALLDAIQLTTKKNPALRGTTAF